jgi:hypothetical protein
VALADDGRAAVGAWEAEMVEFGYLFGVGALCAGQTGHAGCNPIVGSARRTVGPVLAPGDGP